MGPQVEEINVAGPGKADKAEALTPRHEGDDDAQAPIPQRLRGLRGYVKRFEDQLVQYNIEARGIERVEENERHVLSWVAYVQVFLLWVSINLAANNVTLGMLGPAVYELSFRDSALCSVFGAFIGSLAAAWAATWGPVSGNRTLVSVFW
jgi:hypothetical protein